MGILTFVAGAAVGASLQSWAKTRLQKARQAFRRRGTVDFHVSESRAISLQIGHTTARTSFLRGRSVLLSFHRTPLIDLDESLRNRPLHRGDLVSMTKPSGNGPTFIEFHADRCFRLLGRITILVQIW